MQNLVMYVLITICIFGCDALNNLKDLETGGKHSSTAGTGGTITAGGIGDVTNAGGVENTTVVEGSAGTISAAGKGGGGSCDGCPSTPTNTSSNTAGVGGIYSGIKDLTDAGAGYESLGEPCSISEQCYGKADYCLHTPFMASGYCTIDGCLLGSTIGQYHCCLFPTQFGGFMMVKNTDAQLAVTCTTSLTDTGIDGGVIINPNHNVDLDAGTHANPPSDVPDAKAEMNGCQTVPGEAWDSENYKPCVLPDGRKACCSIVFCGGVRCGFTPEEGAYCDDSSGNAVCARN